MPGHATVHYLTQSYFLSATDASGKPIDWDLLVRLENFSSGISTAVHAMTTDDRRSRRGGLKIFGPRNQKVGFTAAARFALKAALLNATDLMCDVCAVYGQDYVCLGYTVPSACLQRRCLRKLRPSLRQALLSASVGQGRNTSGDSVAANDPKRAHSPVLMQRHSRSEGRRLSTSALTASSSAPATLQSTGWRRPFRRGEFVPPTWRLSNYDASGMLKEQHKRSDAARILAKLQDAPLLRGPGVDVYEFGVFTGGGLRALATALRVHGLSFGTLWGFDSFRGLPDNDVARHSPHQAHNRAWKAGGLNAAEQLSLVLGSRAYSFAALRDHIVDRVRYNSTVLVPGFFNESLRSMSAALRRRMRPAMLIDVDCDIYEGTVEALEFMLAERLLVPGTVVYYDDWQRKGEGERKAHVELSQKYRLRWQTLRNDLYRLRSRGLDVPQRDGPQLANHSRSTRRTRRAGHSSRTRSGFDDA